MKIFLSSIFMMISVHVFGLVTSKEESKKNIKLKNILILILFAILHTIINLYLDSSIKTLAICLLYTMYFYIIFDKKVYKSIFSSVLYIILAIIPDLLTLTIITKILNMSKEYCHNYIAGSVLGNMIIGIMLILMVLLLRKPLKTVVNYKLSNNVKIVTVSALTLITIAIFFYNLIGNFRHDNDIYTYLLVIITLIVILVTLLRQKIDNENMFKKYDDLLTIMKNYESDIEEQRTINHESKNELLTIRSKLSEENDKELCSYIDSIIGDKKSVKSAKFSKFKYLPSNGLKGFFYYKFIEAEKRGIKVSLNISKLVENSYLGDMKTKDFKDLTRIIGVYLDNAIEAASTSKDKKLGIEIYEVKGIIQIIISNTYDNAIEKDKVGNERYSTKGKNRGHGLLLVKRILNENNRITSETKITDSLYIQTIKINEK
ncbi:MAG: GHKL domain-containing protein [Bacilli bacterium]|nr:GHKL domain-containing protein [Bacilli bacterium]